MVKALQQPAISCLILVLSLLHKLSGEWRWESHFCESLKGYASDTKWEVSRRKVYRGISCWNFRDVKFVFLFGIWMPPTISQYRHPQIQGGSSRSQDQGIDLNMSPFGITSLALRHWNHELFGRRRGRLVAELFRVNWFHQFLQRYGTGRALFGKIMCDRHRIFLLAKKPGLKW